MSVRSTVCLPRALLLRVDEYARARGWPHGPGHRTEAVGHLLELALERVGEPDPEVPLANPAGGGQNV